MHPIFRVFLGALLLTTVPGAIAQATTPAVPVFTNLQNDPLYDQETYQALHDVVIDISWNHVELGRALRDLTLAARTARPIAADIDFRISSTAPPALRQHKISLQLKRTSIYDVLEYLSQQASFTIKVHPALVLVAPR